MDTAKDLIRVLRRINQDRDRRIDQKLDELLGLGCQTLDLPIGLVSRTRYGQLQIIRIVNRLGTAAFNAGDVLPLCETFCEATLAEGRPVLIEHASRTGWQDHPAFVKLRMECYAGVPLTVDHPETGRTDPGALCLMGPEPRLQNFCAEEVERLCMIADAAQALLGPGPV